MPKLEEIEDYEDIDNLEMSLAELDPSLKTPIAPKVPSGQTSGTQNSALPGMPLGGPTLGPRMAGRSTERIEFINPETGKIEGSTAMQAELLRDIKTFQILYPCYFDKNRSHKEGRRVPLELAVENPLAKTIADALRELGILCIFEGEKTHPQDFGNPGRVRILFKKDGKLVDNGKTYTGGKRQLMKAVAKYLQAHPTTIKSLREIPYGPDFDGIEFKKIPRVKGFKMNDIVPLHSPFLWHHPMTKSIYEAPPPPTNPKKGLGMPKNKYKVIRR